MPAAHLVGGFVWPAAGDPVFQVTGAQWHWLVTWVDWQRLSAVPPAHWQA